MIGKTTGKRLAWLAATFVVALSPAIADTITTKTGDTIRGTVKQFRTNHHATASSAFVVEVDGHEQTIPLHKVETITFEPRPAGGAPVAAGVAGPARKSSRSSSESGAVEESKSESDSHWLTTSSHKRHNSKCRYFKTGKGRPCGPDEGTPCKVCGG